MRWLALGVELDLSPHATSGVGIDVLDPAAAGLRTPHDAAAALRRALGWSGCAPHLAAGGDPRDRALAAWCVAEAGVKADRSLLRHPVRDAAAGTAHDGGHVAGTIGGRPVHAALWRDDDLLLAVVLAAAERSAS